MEVLGTLSLTFKLPNVAEPFTFPFTVIKDINYSVILGYNFFELQDVKIYPRQRAMFYRTHRIPFLSATNIPTSDQVSAILTVGKNYKIQPGTQVKIFVSRPDVPENTLGLISGLPIENDHSIGIAEVSQGLTKIPTLAQTSIPVLFSNLTPRTVFIKKGTPLASFYEVAEDDIDYYKDTTGEDIPILHLPTEITSQINELSATTTEGTQDPLQSDNKNPSFSFTADPSITPENKIKLRKILEKYVDIFATSSFDISRATMEPIQIDVGAAKPICLRPLKTSEFQKQEIKKHVSNFLKAGILQRSTSPWASPCFVVHRAGSTQEKPHTRLVVSYVKLNSIIRKQAYPMPNFETVLNFLAGGQYFSICDATNAFHSLPLHPNSQHLTAFVTPHMGKFEWKVIPMGISIGNAHFSSFVDSILQDSPAAMSYVDDVVVRSATQETHLMHIEDTLFRLQQAGLKLNANKCKFFQKSVTFLGYKFSQEGCSVLPEKIEAIDKLSPPRNKKGVRSFLGFINYYAGFIKHFSSKAAPLTNLLKTSQKFDWQNEQQESFDLLKDELRNAVTLSYPQLDKVSEKSPLHLTCDASGVGISGILSQNIDGKEHILGIHSKKLTPQQQRLWTISEKELYAIVSSVQRYAHILHMTPLKVKTDHRAIVNLLCKTSSSPRLARWSQYLSTFSWGSPNIFQFIKGSENPADVLSRHPQSPATDMEPDLGIPPPAPALLQKEPSSKQPQVNVRVNALIKDKQPDAKMPSVLEILHPQQRPFAMDLQHSPPQVTFPISMKQLAALQKEDNDFAKIITHLKDSNQPAPHLGKVITACFHLGNDDELYYDTAYSAQTTKPTARLAIPETLRHLIISLSHDPVSHNSANATFERLSQSYYWPKARQDCNNYVDNCLICNLRSDKSQKQIMGHIPLPITPNESISIDVLHLPKSQDGFTKVLGLVDEFTGYIALYPLRKETSEVIAEILLTQHIPLYGFFRQIRSDNASTNCGKILTTIYERLGIKHKRSSPHTSRGNPIIERKFRDAQHLLSKSTQPDITNWPQYLAQICFTLNTMRSKASKYTPFYLAHGYEAIQPADLLMAQDNHCSENYTLPTSLENLTTNLHNARQNILKHRQQNEQAYNKKFRTSYRNLQPGTPVAVKIENFPSILDAKLSLKYQPGFIVIRHVSPYAIEIQHSLTGIKRTVNIEKLKIQPSNTCLKPEHTSAPQSKPSNLMPALDLPTSNRQRKNKAPKISEIAVIYQLLTPQ